MTLQRQVSLQDADKLLQPGQHIHVLRQKAGHPDGEETWERYRVLSQMAICGALLSGEQARKANHGLACQLEDGAWLFFETAHG